MSRKEDFLAKIRASVRDAYDMPDLSALTGTTYADPLERFREECKVAGAAVVDAAPGESLDDIVSRAYPDAKVREIEKDRLEYEVKLDNRYELTFNSDLVLIDVDYDD